YGIICCTALQRKRPTTMNTITKKMPAFFLLLATVAILSHSVHARVLSVGKGQLFPTIKSAIDAAENGDTLLISKGVYKEGNLVIKKAICLIGNDKPVLDGELKYEILTVRSDSVVIKGLTLQNCSRAALNDPAAIKVYRAKHITIEGNTLVNNF